MTGIFNVFTVVHHYQDTFFNTYIISIFHQFQKIGAKMRSPLGVHFPKSDHFGSLITVLAFLFHKLCNGQLKTAFPLYSKTYKNGIIQWYYSGIISNKSTTCLKEKKINTITRSANCTQDSLLIASVDIFNLYLVNSLKRSVVPCCLTASRNIVSDPNNMRLLVFWSCLLLLMVSGV